METKELKKIVKSLNLNFTNYVKLEKEGHFDVPVGSILNGDAWGLIRLRELLSLGVVKQLSREEAEIAYLSKIGSFRLAEFKPKEVGGGFGTLSATWEEEEMGEDFPSFHHVMFNCDKIHIAMNKKGKIIYNSSIDELKKRIF